VNVVLWIALEVTGGSDNARNLLRWGAKYGPAIVDGEWWRLIVPVFLHVGLFHLIANSIGLIAFGGTAEQTFGSATFAAVYLLAGVLGNVASFWAGPTLGAGASGALFGIAGAFASHLVINRRAYGQMGNQALVSIAFVLVINLALGFVSTGIDNAAHLGGLIGGAVLGWALAPRQRTTVQAIGPFQIGPLVRTSELRASGLRQVVVIVAAAVIVGLLAYGAYQTKKDLYRMPGPFAGNLTR
jgi:rhomboid protease GluP